MIFLAVECGSPLSMPIIRSAILQPNMPRSRIYVLVRMDLLRQFFFFEPLIVELQSFWLYVHLLDKGPELARL